MFEDRIERLKFQRLRKLLAANFIEVAQSMGMVRSSGNPDPGDVPVTDVIDEQMEPAGECTQTDPDWPDFQHQDCMKWTIYNGKILFRLSSYDYMRSRANEACMAMGGWLAIAFTEQDHQESETRTNPLFSESSVDFSPSLRKVLSYCLNENTQLKVKLFKKTKESRRIKIIALFKFSSFGTGPLSGLLLKIAISRQILVLKLKLPLSAAVGSQLKKKNFLTELFTTDDRFIFFDNFDY